MAQTPYSTQSPTPWTHIGAAGTVNVNTGAVLSVNINSYTSGAAVSISDGTIAVGDLALTDFVAPGNLPLGPGGAGLVINSGTAVVVTSGTCDITLAHR